MENSILNSVKKVCDIDTSNTDFDDQLIMIINSVIMTLRQIGIGPENGYFITGSSETWSNYITDLSMLQSVKPYVCYKTKLIFDPSANAQINSSIKEMLSEYEWRLNIEIDIPEEEG